MQKLDRMTARPVSYEYERTQTVDYRAACMLRRVNMLDRDMLGSTLDLASHGPTAPVHRRHPHVSRDSSVTVHAISSENEVFHGSSAARETVKNQHSMRNSFRPYFHSALLRSRRHFPEDDKNDGLKKAPCKNAAQSSAQVYRRRESALFPRPTAV